MRKWIRLLHAETIVINYAGVSGHVNIIHSTKLLFFSALVVYAKIDTQSFPKLSLYLCGRKDDQTKRLFLVVGACVLEENL